MLFRSALRSLIGLGTLAVVIAISGCATDGPAPPSVADTQNGWKPIGPGGGGSTFIPTIHPRDPNLVLLRCDMSGAYLTKDGGESWELLNFPGGAQAFAFDPSDTSVMYVGAAGLHGSRDGGLNWRLLFPGPGSIEEVRYINDHASISYQAKGEFPDGTVDSVSAILVDRQEPGHILAGVNGRSASGGLSTLYGSRDRGETWVRIAHLDSSAFRIFQPPGESGQMLVFTRRSWLAVDRRSDRVVDGPHSIPEEYAPLMGLDGGLDPETGEFRLWAIASPTRNRQSGRALLVSLDQARTWREIAPFPNAENSQAQSTFSTVSTSAGHSRHAYVTCDRHLERNPQGELGHWYGVLRTRDGGESWDWVYRAGGGSSDYTVRDGQTARNIDDSWAGEAFGGEYIRMLDVAVHAEDPEIVIFTDWYRTMRSDDGGQKWRALYSETLPNGAVRSRGLDVTTSYGVHFDPFDPNHLAISYTDIGYFQSFDRGETWSRSVSGVPPEWDNTCYWLQFDPEVEGRVWSAWSSWHDIPRLKMIRQAGWQERAVGGVCLSTDGGRSWTVSSHGLPDNAPTTSLVLDPNSPSDRRVLFASVYGKGVFKSEDGGHTWEVRNKGLGSNHNAWELTLARDGALYLLVSHNTRFENGKALPELALGELYRSLDGAGTWERIELPTRVRFPNSLCIDADNPNLLYLACWASLVKADYGSFPDGDSIVEAQGGVVASEDGGHSWKSVFDPSAYVYAVSSDPRKPGRLYLNTFQNAAFYSNDRGESWKKLEGYDFRWGHRVFPDPLDPASLFVTTFGGSVFRGPAPQ